MWDLIYAQIHIFIYIYINNILRYIISIYIISTIYICQAILPYKQNTHTHTHLNHTIAKSLSPLILDLLCPPFFFRLQVTEEFVDDHRLHDIQFQLSRFSTKCHSDIIAWDGQNESPFGRGGPLVKPMETYRNGVVLLLFFPNKKKQKVLKVGGFF